MRQQLAAVLKGPEDIVVERVEVPRLQADEILVRVHATGICGSDLHWFRGHDPWHILSYPTRLGHETAGTIEEGGSSGHAFQVGDRVAVRPAFLRNCGTCDQCALGHSQLCRHLGLDHSRIPAAAGFAEVIAVQSGDLFKVPPSVSLEAAALADVYGSALHAVRSTFRDGMRTLLVLGTGPVAIAVSQVARHFGFTQLIMLGRRDQALTLARRTGFVGDTVNMAEEDPLHRTRELCGGKGVDAVIDAVGGNASTAKLALELVDSGGMVCLSGAFWEPIPIDYRLLSSREVTLIAPNAYGSYDGVPELEHALTLMASGVIDAAAMITHRFTLTRVRDAFLTSSARSAAQAMKVVVVPQP